MLAGHSIMQIAGGRFKGEQPTLAHFQLRLLSLPLQPSPRPKAMGGRRKDLEKTQRPEPQTPGQGTVENLVSSTEEDSKGPRV